ncbi:MFS transporter [Roseateles sp. NT4]|uniref:MFS transporter n=1 Tax=Roseateles sp. NT4 TaxID=3453715 RepID=UPI003EEB8290
MTEIPARTRWAIVLLLCACGVLAGGQFAKISIEFTRLQAVYAASPAGMGLLLSTVGVVGLLCGVVTGLLAPRVGYRRLLLIGLVGGALLSGLQALLPPFGLFWASRIPEGAAHLAIMVATPTLLIHASAPAHRTGVMGLWATVVGLSFALLAALDRSLPEGLAPRAALAGHTALLLLAAAAVRFWVADVATPAASPSARFSVLTLHREVYADLHTALPGLAFFFYAFPTIALITFVPRFSGQGQAGFQAALPLMATAGTLAAGWAARRFQGGPGLVRWAYLAFAASALMLAVAAAAGIPTEALALLTLTCAGLGGGAASTLIPQLNPAPAQQARASGVLVQLGNLGSVSGPPLFAALADRFGLAGLAGLAAFTAALALLVLGRLAARLQA